MGKIRFAAVILTVFIFVAVFPSGGGAVITAGAASYSADMNIRIGLMFDSNTIESYQTSAPYGFELGYISRTANTVFVPLHTITNTSVAVSRDENLSKNAAGRYYVSQSSVAVGKYHVEFVYDFSDAAFRENFIKEAVSVGFSKIFVAYYDGKITVRADAFTTAEAAQAYINSLGAYYNMKVSQSSSNAMTVIDPATNAVVFEFDSGTANLGIRPVQRTGSAQAYTTSPANNLYSGIFEYRRTSIGIEVMELVKLDDYIKGVLPSEIYTSWPMEALKAFAITARTYTMYTRGTNRHASQGFEICNETHCQAYNGVKNATANTNAAVDATNGLVITYNNKLIEAVYHSSSGGATENHNDAWGGSLTHPYLASVNIPFENYTEHPNAKWERTADAKTLTDYLMNVSVFSSTFRNSLKTTVAKITVLERSLSGYIKSIRVTDSSGNSAVITNSDSVRRAFSRYANSANMEIYNKFNYHLNNLGATEISTKALYLSTGTGTVLYSSGAAADLAILSADGTHSLLPDDYTFVFDGKGYGHGVGLSQFGMYDLAVLGKVYEEILKTFYTGVQIKNLSEIN